MRNDLEWLETEMRRANPIPRHADVADEAAAVALLVSRGRHTMQSVRDRTESPAPKRPHRALVAFASAAALVLTFGGITLWALGRNGTTPAGQTTPAPTTSITTLPPTTTSTPTTTAASTTAASTTTTTSPIPAWTTGAGWARTGEGAEGGYGGMLRVVALDDDLVALGYDHEVGLGAVWISADGLTWEGPVAVDWVPWDLEAVAATGAGLVAVTQENTRLTGEDPAGGPVVRVRTSPDGREWVVAADLPLGTDSLGEGGHLALAAGPEGLVLAGVVCVPECENAVWVSADDPSAWERVPAEATGLSTAAVDEHPAQFLDSVVATDEGFLAGGTDYADDSSGPLPTFFQSLDGRSWVSIGRIDAGQGSVTDILVLEDDTYLALIGSPPDYPIGALRIYGSSDAQTWTLVHEEPTSWSGVDLVDLGNIEWVHVLFFDDSAVSGEWVAVVGSVQVDDSWNGIALLSPDGSEWALVGLEDETFLDGQVLGISRWDDGFAAVGQSCNLDGDLCRWITWAWTPPE
jgi:hypothetical protein